MKFLINPDSSRAKPRGKIMARRMPPRHKSGPKKGQFMSKRARAARKSSPRKRRARRNPGRSVAQKNPVRRRRPAVRRAAPRRAPRRNPPKRMDLVRSFTDGAVEAGQILFGKAVVRSVPDLAGLPKEGNVGLAIQAVVALGAGFVAEMFLSRDAARAILAGGLTAPLETAIVAYQVPWLSGALSPVTQQQTLGAYVRGGSAVQLGRYARERTLPTSTDRGMGSYASAGRY